jgi:hypothetical protein
MNILEYLVDLILIALFLNAWIAIRSWQQQKRDKSQEHKSWPPATY